MGWPLFTRAVGGYTSTTLLPYTATMRHLPSYRGEGNFLGWVFTVTRNLALEGHWKRSRRRKKLEGYRMELTETHTPPERIEDRIAEGKMAGLVRDFFMQEFMGTFPPYSVRARVISRSPEEVFLDEIMLIDDSGMPRFTTSVRIRIGQTLVLGSAERYEDRATVILTVRAETAQ